MMKKTVIAIALLLGQHTIVAHSSSTSGDTPEAVVAAEAAAAVEQEQNEEEIPQGVVTSSKLQISVPKTLNKIGGYDHREARESPHTCLYRCFVFHTLILFNHNV